MQRIALYPGTFDPITNGHVNLIKRGLKLFDKLVIAVAQSQRKSPCILWQDRVKLIELIFKNENQLRVVRLEGLSVDVAKAHQAQFILRGLRSGDDFNYEVVLSGMNRCLDESIETVFLASHANEAIISSTIVREIVSCQGDVSSFVPPEVVNYLKRVK